MVLLQYLAEGADTEHAHHEIGHLVETMMLSKSEVAKIKKQYFKDIDYSDVFKDNWSGQDIILIRSSKLISEYQGRIYVKSIADAFDKNGKLKTEHLLEFISEPYSLYIREPEVLKKKDPKLFKLIDEAVR